MICRICNQVMSEKEIADHDETFGPSMEADPGFGNRHIYCLDQWEKDDMKADIQEMIEKCEKELKSKTPRLAAKRLLNTTRKLEKMNMLKD